jgi:hypothetical protein
MLRPFSASKRRGSYNGRMSDLVPFPAPAPEETREHLYLVGFRLDPSQAEPQLFTLIAMDGSNDRPAMAQDRILFCSGPALAPAVLARSDNGLQLLGPAPTDVGFICDVAEALHTVNALPDDEHGIVDEVISSFDTLVRASKINVPAQYMSVLSALAERLNEDSEFATWLAAQGVDRETIEDAIIWCVGAVGVKTTVIR